jgi:hypothetical protein
VDGNNIFLASYGHNHDWINVPEYGKGVYFSNNDGNSWVQINEGLTHLNVSKIKQAKNGDIFCSTYGGFYKFDKVTRKWSIVFSLNNGQSDIAVSDFAFIYDGSGHPEKVYLTTGGLGLVGYSFSNEELSLYEYGDAGVGYSITFDKITNSIVTTHALGGIRLWDASNMSKKSFLENTGWIMCGILYDGKIISGAYGGYLSAYVTNINTNESILCTKGLFGNHNITSAILFDGNTFFGITSGILVRSADGTDNFIKIIDPDTNNPIGEVWDFKVDESGDLYFQDFNTGIWKYNSIDNVQKLSLRDPYNNTNAGAGQKFQFRKGRVYISKANHYLSKTGGFQAFDVSTGDMLYYANGLPISRYGWWSNFQILMPKILFVLYPEQSLNPSLYLSIDEGKNFNFIDHVSNHFIGLYGKRYFYIKDGYLCSQSADLLTFNKYMDIPSQAFVFLGDYLFVYNNSKIKLYEPSNLTLLDIIDLELTNFQGFFTIAENGFAIIGNSIYFIYFSNENDSNDIMPWIPLLLLDR